MSKQVKLSNRTSVVKSQPALKDILPFAEKPAVNRLNPKGGIKENPDAADLFSYFTADVIKAKTIFTR